MSENLKIILGTLPEGIILYDEKSKNVELANQAFKKLLNLDAAITNQQICLEIQNPLLKEYILDTKE